MSESHVTRWERGSRPGNLCSREFTTRDLSFVYTVVNEILNLMANIYILRLHTDVRRPKINVPRFEAGLRC